jgi:hypothetical protein
LNNLTFCDLASGEDSTLLRQHNPDFQSMLLVGAKPAENHIGYFSRLSDLKQKMSSTKKGHDLALRAVNTLAAEASEEFDTYKE